MRLCIVVDDLAAVGHFQHFYELFRRLLHGLGAIVVGFVEIVVHWRMGAGGVRAVIVDRERSLAQQ